MNLAELTMTTETKYKQKQIYYSQQTSIAKIIQKHTIKARLCACVWASMFKRDVNLCNQKKHIKPRRGLTSSCHNHIIAADSNFRYADLFLITLNPELSDKSHKACRRTMSQILCKLPPKHFFLCEKKKKNET